MGRGESTCFGSHSWPASNECLHKRDVRHALGVKLRGPDEEDEELEEALGSPTGMGSPQSSLVMPWETSLADSSAEDGPGDTEHGIMSANALAEDEATAEAGGSLKDESQVCVLPAVSSVLIECCFARHASQ